MLKAAFTLQHAAGMLGLELKTLLKRNKQNKTKQNKNEKGKQKTQKTKTKHPPNKKQAEQNREGNPAGNGRACAHVCYPSWA